MKLTKTTYLRKVTSDIIVSISLKSYGLVVQLPLMRYFPDCLHPELRQPSNPLQLELCTQPKWSLTGPLRAQQSAGSPKSPLTFYCHNSLQNLQQQALWQNTMQAKLFSVYCWFSWTYQYNSGGVGAQEYLQQLLSNVKVFSYIVPTPSMSIKPSVIVQSVTGNSTAGNSM